MRILSFLSICLLLAIPCMGKMITVDDDGLANFNTIQAAIDYVNTIDGDEIVVSEGTYYESINTFGKVITIRSTNPLDSNTVLNTIIDSNSSEFCITFDSGEGANTVIKGFLITGGGLGIDCYNSSPTFTNCSISGNRSFNGGGMVCSGGNPTLTNCTFSGNFAANNGGGMFCTNSNPTLTNCTFSGNSAINSGGGMFCSNSNPTLTNCTFNVNSAGQYGGGMYCENSSPILTDSLICGNLISGTLVPSQIDGSFTDSGGNIINDTCPPPVTRIEGDLDGDGDVDFNDFAIMANNWLRNTRENEATPLDMLLLYLEIVRDAIELYKIEHLGRLPGEGLATFTDALTCYTDIYGAVVPAGTPGAKGPYLQEIPINPFSSVPPVIYWVRIDGAAAGADTHHWRFDTSTGHFQADDSGMTPDGTPHTNL